MSSSNVRVVCRFRPINKREELEASKKKHQGDTTCVALDSAQNLISIKHLGNNSKKDALQFVLDKVLPTTTTQDDCFQAVAEPAVRDILKGYNGTIFAYGQTGSGKTHTMYGPETFDPEQSGIVPRAISMLFQSLEDNQFVVEFTIKVSFVEIYMESLQDLLNVDGSMTANGKATKARKTRKSKKTKTVHKSAKQKRAEKEAAKLRIRTLPNGSTIIQNLYEEECESLMEVLGLIQRASRNRTTSSTLMNSTSSRSHLLMTALLTQKMQDGSTRISKLNFVDLAGSEKVKKTAASGTRLEEAKMINKSLTQLGIVIRALAEKKSFISYRDSTLTHILKDSLGGNTKTTLVVACSPHVFNRDETVSTLRFATRCRMIANKVFKNMVLSPQQMTQLIKNLKEEIVDLKQKLQDKVIHEIESPKGVDDDNKTQDFAMEKSALSMDVQKRLAEDLKNFRAENSKLQKEQEKNKEKEEELQRLIAQLRSQIEDEKERHQDTILKMEGISSELTEAKQSITEKDEMIEELQHKITDLNARLLQSSNEQNQQSMQLEFLGTIYSNKLKRVEEDEDQMKHQLQLIREIMERATTKSATSSPFGSESQFYQVQESRLQEALQLLQQEKTLLTSKFESLGDQLKNLQSYLDLKDDQLKTLTNQLNEEDKKWKEKEDHLGRSSVTINSLNETIHKLQDENAALEKKIKAYFAFNTHATQHSLSDAGSIGSMTPQSSSPWDNLPSRGRGQSEAISTQSDRRRRRSIQREDGDNLLKQQEYLTQFNALRVQREKERLEAERLKRKQEQEEALKRKKAEEVAAAAAERERKMKEKLERKREEEEAEEERQRQLAEERLKELEAQKTTKPVSTAKSTPKATVTTEAPKKVKREAPAWLNPEAAEKKDGKSGLNPYKKKKKGKRFKSSRKKVSALISGFEQIENEEQVFDEEEVNDDPTAMFLRMLSTSIITETDPRKC